LAGYERFEVWELPTNIGELRDRLLALWLGAKNGAALSCRIVAESLSGTVVSGYDLRLLADLAGGDPEHAALPPDRISLYRAMLARASGADGQPLRLEGLEKLAWTMVTQRRRRIVPEDEKGLEMGTLKALEREGLRIVRSLVEETPTLAALQQAATDAGTFGLNRRDQGRALELRRTVGDLDGRPRITVAFRK
jgi:hypothetical protein